ncbi:MAG: hypothetical protein HBSAPP04_09000 [Ignavibacteriaceae bacterium]|nr:MAG: hypothetical protein HBSAPP04_09000 [Ignavibacteriaceae bacterium]
MSNNQNSTVALESAGAFLWVVDLDDLEMTYSTNFDNLFGYRSESILKKGGIGVLMVPEDIDLMMEKLEQCRAGESSRLLIDFRLRRSDGGICWCRSVGSVREPHEGKRELAGITYDISMEKQKELEIGEMRDRFELIAQNTSDGILVIKGKTIEFASKSYLGQLGYPEEEEIGRTSEAVANLIHPEDRHVIGEIFEAIGRKEKTLIYLYRAQRKDGSYIWREDLANFFYDENGDYYQSIVVARDVTFRVETTKKLEEAKEKAEEVARLKSNLLNNMSHEFRTPMIGILGYSEMLTKSLHDDEQKKWASNIYKAGSRLMRTLNLLLDYAKWESETVFPGFESVDPAKLIRQSVDLFTLEADKKGLKLKTECPCEGFRINTNFRMLENIMDNLIDNAIKFTDSGEVSIRGYRDLNEFKIEVADTGIGISSQHQTVIFEEFRQASEGIGRTHEGAGLGLTLSKLWCEKIGASINVQSEPGKGSVFTVTLPIQESD